MESCVAKDWWTTQCLMGQGGYLTQTAYTHKAVFDLHPETDVLRSNFRRLDEWMRFDPPDRKPVRLSLVFLLGFLFSLAVVVGLTWLFAAYETANWFPWLHEPRLSQDKFFEVIRNAVTMGAALGVGITLFYSYRRQRTTEGTQRITAEAQRTAAEAQKTASKALELSIRQYALELDRRQDAVVSELRSRYSVAAEQLSAQALTVKLAGVMPWRPLPMTGIGNSLQQIDRRA